MKNLVGEDKTVVSCRTKVRHLCETRPIAQNRDSHVATTLLLRMTWWACRSCMSSPTRFFTPLHSVQNDTVGIVLLCHSEGGHCPTVGVPAFDRGLIARKRDSHVATTLLLRMTQWACRPRTSSTTRFSRRILRMLLRMTDEMVLSFPTRFFALLRMTQWKYVSPPKHHPIFRQKRYYTTFSSSRTSKEKFTSTLPRREKVHEMNANEDRPDGTYYAYFPFGRASARQ